MTSPLKNIFARVRKGIFENRVQLGILACFALLGAVVAAIPSGSVSQKSNLSNEWVLPVDPVPTLTSDIGTMLANPLFGGDPVIIEVPEQVETNDALVKDEWRLIGIITEGGVSQIVIFNQGTEKLESARVGDTLPGGEILTGILENSIEFISENEGMSISLFRDTERYED